MFERKPVIYKVRGEIMESVAVIPSELSHPAACVLVCPDWSGINQYTMASCEEMARLGYVGFATDVYGQGNRGEPAGDNTALMNPCLADRAMLQDRLLSAMSAAGALDEVAPNRFAALGFCFGGLCGLDLARSDPDGLVGVVTVHGGLSPPPGAITPRIRARLLILHGWEDPMVGFDDVVAAAGEFSKAGADWEFRAYAYAMHAFTFAGANYPERGIQHNPLADRRSKNATQSFLKEVFEPLQHSG